MTRLADGQRVRVAVVRGPALNKWEMQNYEPLRPELDVVAIGSRNGDYDVGGLALPVTRLPAPTTLFGQTRFAARLLRRLGVGDELLGLERRLARAHIAHGAETFIRSSQQIVRARERLALKVVLTCWENIPFLHDQDPVLSARKQYVRPGVDLFLAVTPLAKRALVLEGVDEAKIRVVPMGVDVDAFRPAAKDMSLLRRYGVSSSAPVVLYSGRLIREKGLVDLVLSARILHDRGYRDVRFLFVGAGPERPRLETVATTLGIRDAIVFVPPAPYREMPRIHALADIFVLPSVPTPYWQEQFGMVLAEALASGRPVVAAASGSIADVLADAGILVPPYSADALANAMAPLLDDAGERSRLGERARSTACDVYDSRKVAARLKEAYETVLA